MTGVDLIRSSTLSDVAEYAYASRIAVADAELIFIAGACPLDRAGNTVAGGDVAGQAWQVPADRRPAPTHGRDGYAEPGCLVTLQRTHGSGM